MREHFIEQTAWAAVIFMSWINILRLEQLTIIGSDNVLSPGDKPLSEPMLEYCRLDP